MSLLPFHHLPPEILARPVAGLNLFPGGFAAQFHTRQPTLIVFLRHFGCVFCRETVTDLHYAATANLNFPEILFVYHGTPDEGRRFFFDLWPAARAIADPERVFYEAFQIPRGGMVEVFGGEALLCTIRAISKGHFIQSPQGDPWLMPGLFLVMDGEIHWHHHFQHAGDHPDWQHLARLSYNLTKNDEERVRA